MQLRNVCWLVAAVLLEAAYLSSATSSTAAKVPKEVEENLLSLFGFKKRPKVDRSKVVIPQAMLELYEKQTGRKLDTGSLLKPGLHTKSANTVRSFTHVESPIDARFRGHHKFRLKFDIRNIPSGERLKAAELTLNRDIVNWLSNEGSDANEHFQHVLINDIIKPGIKGKRRPITRLIDSKLIDIRKNHTLSMDVASAVHRWIESPSSNHGVLVEIVGYGKNEGKPKKHVRLRRDADEGDRTWATRQPLLFTYTDDGRNKQVVGEALAAKRARRSSSRRKKNKKDLPCRRHTMYVDFTEVGWNNWIVAPPGYDAFYCHGECPYMLSEHLNTTNHAIVQNVVNSMNPSKVPKPCCVPTNLTSISMLYVDDGNRVVLKNYKGMAVLDCGCQ